MQELPKGQVDNPRFVTHICVTMKTATVRDIRHDFGRILSWVEEGQQVEITKRRRIVARMVPVKPRSVKMEWPDFEARLKNTFPSGVKGKPVSEVISEERGEY
jgi:prevent-host-death family protein